MEFNVQVIVGDGDTFLYSADAAAQQVIAALGGNPTKDVCYVTVTQASQGQAGTPPPPLIPPA